MVLSPRRRDRLLFAPLPGAGLFYPRAGTGPLVLCPLTRAGSFCRRPMIFRYLVMPPAEAGVSVGARQASIPCFASGGGGCFCRRPTGCDTLFCLRRRRVFLSAPDGLRYLVLPPAGVSVSVGARRASIPSLPPAGDFSRQRKVTTSWLRTKVLRTPYITKTGSSGRRLSGLCTGDACLGHLLRLRRASR